MKDGSTSGLRRIAYFSPLPPEHTGIADYSNELLPFIARLAQVTLFATHPEQVVAALRTAFEVRPLEDYDSRPSRYDVAVYHMGNSMYHDALYRVLLRHPGITVLHEFGLHHFIATRTIGQGDFGGYAREMGYSLGTEGIDLAHRIRQGEAECPLFTVSLNERLLDHSLGVIVHSHYAKDRIRDVRPNLPVTVVKAPICSDLGPLRSRSELGCPEDALIFACAGHLFRTKQVAFAMDAFCRLRADFPRARFAIIGEQSELDWDLHAWLQERNLADSVIYTGHLPDIRDFVSWIAASDILVSLRHPTAGETSATTLRGLAAGRPVIVSDHGWYAELPDDVCVKVTPDDEEALYQAMRRLASDPALRREIGQRAATYAQREHSLSVAAQRYLDFIEEVFVSLS